MTDQRFLWRLETEGGLGFYSNMSLSESGLVGSYSSSSGRHPMPGCDGVPNFHGESIFGFDSLALTREWFYEPEDGDTIHEAGIKLAAFRVEDVTEIKRGQRQLVFLRGAAKPVYIDIRELWSRSDESLNELAASRFKQLDTAAHSQ